MSNSWLNIQNANRFQNIYLQGFLDISGGNVILRNGGLTVNGNTVVNNKLSANGIIVNTFGQSMIGNILSHPFSISASNSSNFALVMGYDISNNAGYINSLSQTEFTNLCLQPQGGFLGIGNSSPKYTLDISGTVNISGNTFINGNINANIIAIGNSVISYGQITNISGFTGSGLLLNSTDNIFLNTRNTMILNTSGNISLQPSGNRIGIGKVNPQSILDISGIVNINNSSGPSLILSGNNLQIYGSGLGINLDSSSNRVIPSSQILAVDISSNTSDIIFKTAPYSLSGFNSNIERMRISNTGSIGIGTNQPSAAYKIDISGVMRINESTGSGGSTTFGSLVMQHVNSGGASSILFNCPNLNSNYGSLTYYDNLISSSIFPNYTGTAVSALVIDSGGSTNQTNMVIRTNGQFIVDSGSKNTYFVSGVSIGKPSVGLGYSLDVSGIINSNNINSGIVTSGNITINGIGLSVISGNIFSGSVNNFSVPSGNIFSGSVNSISGFAVYSPWIYGNTVTCGNLTASLLNITTISTSGLRLSGTVDNSTINSTYQQTGVSNTTSGSFQVVGGASIGLSLGVGGTIYGNVYSNTINAQTIIIGSSGANNSNVTLQTPAINMFQNGNITGATGSSIVGFPSYIGASGGTIRMDALRIGTFANFGLIVNSGYDISINSTLYAGNVNISSQAVFNQNSLIYVQNTNDVVGSQGALTINGGIYIAKSASINNGANITGTVTVNGPLIQTGAANPINFAGPVTFNSNYNPTSLNNGGALQVVGGASIGNSLYVGGTTSLQNGLNITGTQSFNSVLGDKIVLWGTTGVGNYGIGIGAGVTQIYCDTASNRVGIGYGYSSSFTETLTVKGGNVGIGTITPGYKLDVNGTVNATGQVTAASFNATSDYRIKKNIQSLESSKTIDLLHPVEYDLSGGKHHMGFIAHEVQELFPFLVEGQKDGETIQSLNYNGFIALLVKEVQDLKKENILLREKNYSFESRLQAIESFIQK